LVIQGFHQIYGLDYLETFAPVAKLSSIRLILAIAAMMDWEIHQADVDTAYLQAEVEEEIYMSQPEGYVKFGPNGERLVCRLVRSLYGLKQAGRNWNQLIDKFLKALGFVPSSADPCVYVKRDSDGGVTIIVLYVDDLIIVGSSIDLVNVFKKSIAAQFKIKDLGELKWVLGVEVRRNRQERTLELHQSSYVDQLLERHGMDGCNPVTTPMDGVLRGVDDGCRDEEYMRMVGGLMYGAMVTRPDIAYSVSVLGRHLNASGPDHITAGKRVLRYLKGSKELGIKFGGSGNQKVELVGYVDADWGGDPDSRKSTTGFVFTVGGGAISWGSKLQGSVSLSSAEAEFVAACTATQEALYLRQLMKDVGFAQPKATVIYEDNMAAIALAENPVHHQRTKHIDIKYKFIRDEVKKGKFKLVHIPTDRQLADLFTKPLSKVKVQDLRECVMGYK